MTDAHEDNQPAHRFATAVRDYAPNVSRKVQQLLSLQSGIAELRRKGASYKVISELLKDSGISVSRATVARFCRGQSQDGNANVSATSHKRPSPSHAGHAHGPRVADPNTI